ncbi:hypothetical protein PI124_g20603 [Phytophthora idaei]|nr:hypothetical protein PI124_g20603 [Phytophthora idaei]
MQRQETVVGRQRAAGERGSSANGPLPDDDDDDEPGGPRGSHGDDQGSADGTTSGSSAAAVDRNGSTTGRSSAYGTATGAGWTTASTASTSTSDRAPRRPSPDSSVDDSSDSGYSDCDNDDRASRAAMDDVGTEEARPTGERSTPAAESTTPASTEEREEPGARSGARISGRGDWTDEELYFIMGNKLQDNAASWWVQMDQELLESEKTWTRLKEALMRRYGERPDPVMSEWRVYQRMMCPGETFAGFAAGLRDIAGPNHVSEQTLLGQFYRNLDKTTRMLVKQEPVPTTLEQAVDKATAIDDPIDNVARGMVTIGQPWATAPNAYTVPMDGTMGRVAIIPGVGPAGDALAAQTGTESTEVAYFTNPRGVYNKFTETWDVPDGRVWNGRYWKPTKREQLVRTQSDVRHGGKRGSGEKRGKVRVVQPTAEASDTAESDEGPIQPTKKKQKAAIRKAKVPAQMGKDEPQARGTESRTGKWPTTDYRCYACGKPGYFAKECPDPEAKTRSEAYLASRPVLASTTTGNEERAECGDHCIRAIS